MLLNEQQIKKKVLKKPQLWTSEQSFSQDSDHMVKIS